MWHTHTKKALWSWPHVERWTVCLILLKNLRLSTLFQAISPRDTALIVLHYIVQIKTAKSSLVLDEKGEVEREGPEPHFSLISAQLASAMELFVNIRNRNRQRDAAKISREGSLKLYPTHRYAARTGHKSHKHILGRRKTIVTILTAHILCMYSVEINN